MEPVSHLNRKKTDLDFVFLLFKRLILTNSLRVAGKQVALAALLLLKAPLQVTKRCVHPLGKAALHVTVVLFHLSRRDDGEEG